MVGPGAFVNVHTPLFPEGEIRGHLQNLLPPPTQPTQQPQLLAPAPSASPGAPTFTGIPPVIVYQRLNSSQPGTMLNNANLFADKPGELFLNVSLVPSIPGDPASSLSNIRQVSWYANTGPPANSTTPVKADNVTSRSPFSFTNRKDPKTGLPAFNLFQNAVGGRFTVNAVVQQANNASIVVAASYTVSTRV